MAERKLPELSNRISPVPTAMLGPVDGVVGSAVGEPAILGIAAGRVLQDGREVDRQRRSQRVVNDHVGGDAFSRGLLNGVERHIDGLRRRGVAGGRELEGGQGNGKGVARAVVPHDLDRLFVT